MVLGSKSSIDIESHISSSLGRNYLSIPSCICTVKTLNDSNQEQVLQAVLTLKSIISISNNADCNCNISILRYWPPQIARLMGPTWGLPGSWRPQMDPMLTPWALLSGALTICFYHNMHHGARLFRDYHCNYFPAPSPITAKLLWPYPRYRSTRLSKIAVTLLVISSFVALLPTRSDTSYSMGIYNCQQLNISKFVLMTPIRDTLGRLSIKLSSYHQRDPHVKNKTVLQPSYL